MAAPVLCGARRAPRVTVTAARAGSDSFTPRQAAATGGAEIKTSKPSGAAVSKPSGAEVSKQSGAAVSKPSGAAVSKQSGAEVSELPIRDGPRSVAECAKRRVETAAESTRPQTRESSSSDCRREYPSESPDPRVPVTEICRVS